MDCFAILRRWRKWIRFVVVIIYICLLVIAVPLCIWELERKGAPDHVQAWFIGGMFVLMALPISLWGILQHVINYTTPYLQRHIIRYKSSFHRVLWMVPVYALNAWFALRFPSAAIYLDTLRECYEAYVIYNFMAYLLAFLNHEYPHLEAQIENKPPVKHIFPLCLLPPCHNSLKFVNRCKHGVLQYTVVRPGMTVIALICEMFDKYQEGDFNFQSAWSYIVIINNVSQILAMYCLVLFYKAFKEELQPLKPVPKFLCVKAVVFLSFWQALVIAALAKLGAIPKNGSWVFYKDIKEVSTGLQDFLICIEMFIAAIAHYFSFSHKPFVNLAAEQQGCLASFFSMWDVRDVTQDVVEHARYVGRGVHKTLSRGKRLVTGDSSERTPLLAGGHLQNSSNSMDGESSAQNLQYREPPTPAVILDYDAQSSEGGSISSGLRYDSFVNKSTTASMNNYVDLDRPEANQLQESTQTLSRSVSLKGYDSTEDDLDDTGRLSERLFDKSVHVHDSVDKGANQSDKKSVDKDSVFECLEVHPDDKDEDGGTSMPGATSRENIKQPSASSQEKNSALNENINSTQSESEQNVSESHEGSSSSQNVFQSSQPDASIEDEHDDDNNPVV